MINTNAKLEFEQATVPLISVAMPVYNGEKYLAEAIDSILAQTFVDFELIIIDDGSTDNSLSVLQAYQKRDSRIQLVSRENKNLVATLNEIIDLARGKWIARMDQDDIALPQRFERQLEWLHSTGADISGTWVQRFGTLDRRVVRLSQSDEAVKIEMLFCSPFVHPSVMMRASLLKLLRYDDVWERAEDYDLWVRAAGAGWRMTNVQEVLLLYRVHKSQISTLTSKNQNLLTEKIQHRYWLYFFSKMELNDFSVNDVLNIHQTTDFCPNIDALDFILTKLLLCVPREVQDVVLGHALRLYYRTAANSQNIVSRWSRLNVLGGRRPTRSSLIRLWLLQRFRLQPNGRVFSVLKSFYVALIRTT